MLDFTSAVYLGMRHPSETLESWEQFTTGVPAALETPPGAPVLAAALADLQGCEQATLGTSTLHLFWDLFGMLVAEGMAIYMDDGVYPIARWGIERAAARGAKVRSFPHHDVGALRKLLSRNTRAHHRPVIVSDGFCPGCARHAPIADYLEIARNLGGQLVMDDTQAMGIFGHAASGAPYGSGGGGTLRRFGLSGPGVLSISSLAKGFGVPVAVLAGAREAVESFEHASETRMHCSPPSNAVLSALAHALTVNRNCGDALRLRLAQLVRHFRSFLRALGFTADGGLFPVQTLAGLPVGRAEELHQSLEQLSVRTVLRRDRCRGDARLSFIINTLHTPEMVALAMRFLARAAGAGTRAAKQEQLTPHAWRSDMRYEVNFEAEPFEFYGAGSKTCSCLRSEFKDGVGEMEWEEEAAKGSSAFQYVKSFASSDADCVAALNVANKNRAQALAIINTQIGEAIRMLRVAANKLKRGNRSTQTKAIFQKIFRIPPEVVPTWLKQTATIKDRGDVVATRCSRVADLLERGGLRYFCTISEKNCPDCIDGADYSTTYACSSWGGESAASRNSRVICLNTPFWQAMGATPIDLPDILAVLMHEPFHVYYGKYVTSHSRANPGKFGAVYCTLKFVFEINGRTDYPARVKDVCEGIQARR